MNQWDFNEYKSKRPHSKAAHAETASTETTQRKHGSARLNQNGPIKQLYEQGTIKWAILDRFASLNDLFVSH